MRHYSSHLHTRSHAWLEIVRRVTDTARFRLAMVGIVVMAAFLYVFQVNTVTAKGYEVSELNKKIKTLHEDTRQLDVVIAQEQSLARLSDRLKPFNFVPADGITYVASGSAVVAKR